MCCGKGVLGLIALFFTTTFASTDLSSIQVRYGTVTYSTTGEDSYISNVTLTNVGTVDIDTGSTAVSIYACFIRLVIGSDAQQGVQINSSPVITVMHLDGCSHRIVFSAPFRLAAKTSFSFSMTQKHWSVAYTDVMKNWYIQLGDGEHQPITNTARDQTEFVDPYDTETKYLRTSTDLVMPFTVQDRHKEHAKVNLASDSDVKSRLVPNLFESLVNSDTVYTEVDINQVTFQTDVSLKRGQFRFTVENGNAEVIIHIMSNSTEDKGIALSTIQQLLQRFDGKLPVGSFTSKPPRFNYRGYMIDLARQFHDKDVIKRQLDLMYRFKLNVLHLHISDDESWALEIEGLPELTDVGSKQCFDIDTCATFPQLGRQGTTAQYLSKADYVEIVRYADSLGIMILPEIESPGHATAAVNAMRVRRSSQPSVDYSLDDPEDLSEYLSVQYFTKGAMNPCIPTFYNFTEKVITTLQSYHAEAGQNLTIVHLGGDEVASGAWIGSPACQRLTSNNESLYSDVKIHMMSELGQLAERLNVDLAFWEDGLINKSSSRPFVKDELFPSTVEVYSFTWQTVWEWWGGDRAFIMANGGYKVVLTPATHYYLDHSQEPHPNERGYYWATRYSNLRKAFSFRPINYYANIDGTKVLGEPIDEKGWCNPSWKCPELTVPENIVGIEAPLFGETIQSQEHIDNNAWPRLMAVAERAWCEADWEELDGANPKGLQTDFDSFRQSIERYELPEIERDHGVLYHISPPGATITSNKKNVTKLNLNVEFEGQRVWWRKSGQDWQEATDFKISASPEEMIDLRTSNAAGNRYSYEVSYVIPSSSTPLIVPSSSTPLIATLTSTTSALLVLLHLIV
ncbi:beta-hexosaminidase-like [Watersipora subatra]|uniref:beta-hexosaminidase-like n=1 Tax=Watersipora subatra TaxID=2589382 RepID=UPI00355C5267